MYLVQPRTNGPAPRTVVNLAAVKELESSSYFKEMSLFPIHRYNSGNLLKVP